MGETGIGTSHPVPVILGTDITQYSLSLASKLPCMSNRYNLRLQFIQDTVDKAVH